jgi:hypothetical protein
MRLEKEKRFYRGIGGKGFIYSFRSRNDFRGEENGDYGTRYFFSIMFEAPKPFYLLPKRKEYISLWKLCGWVYEE